MDSIICFLFELYCKYGAMRAFRRKVTSAVDLLLFFFLCAFVLCDILHLTNSTKISKLEFFFQNIV